ncbi:MAG: NUDIX hydrolase [Ignavibacteriaceae bacterium]|jgi:ADP-ribose pyrophosphatase
MNFKLKKSETLFNGKIFDLKVDHIEYDSGNIGIREIAVHPGGAATVAVKDDGKIILVRQFRYPIQQAILELPAGKLDKGEDPLVCAVRELEEETGYKTGKIEKLGIISTSPGFCNEILHLYLAKDLIPGNHNREEGEYGMEILEFSLDEIDRKITNGEIIDAKTICGIYLAKNKLN